MGQDVIHGQVHNNEGNKYQMPQDRHSRPIVPNLRPALSESTPLVASHYVQSAGGEHEETDNPVVTRRQGGRPAAEEIYQRLRGGNVWPVLIGASFLIVCFAYFTLAASGNDNAQSPSSPPSEPDDPVLAFKPAVEGASKSWWKKHPSPTSSPTSASRTTAPTESPTPSPTLPVPSGTFSLGTCWAPDHNMTDPEDIYKDAMLIRRHFNQVRTFYSKFDQASVMPYFVRAGLKVALGIFMYKDEPTWIETEKKAAIDAYFTYPENLMAIYVGNENLIPLGPFSVDDLIGHINDLRKADVKVPIGTVQRITEWVMPSEDLDRLAAAVDIIGCNLYPYFSKEGEDLETQWNKMLARYPHHQHKLRLTETGWPSSGSPNFAHRTATFDQAKGYWDIYLKWACERPGVETFYYTYFDGRAPLISPDYEQYFGVVTATGDPKYDLTEGGLCAGGENADGPPGRHLRVAL